jgi:glycerophosphoryl diester phosphodiesterase
MKLMPSQGGRASGVILQSHSAESLRSLRALQPDVPLLGGQLGGSLDEKFGAIAEYANGIGHPRSRVNSVLMATARRHGLFVHPRTVNESREILRLLELGVEGLFTDRPDRFLELIRKRS